MFAESLINWEPIPQRVWQKVFVINFKNLDLDSSVLMPHEIWTTRYLFYTQNISSLGKSGRFNHMVFFLCYDLFITTLSSECYWGKFSSNGSVELIYLFNFPKPPATLHTVPYTSDKFFVLCLSIAHSISFSYNVFHLLMI